MYINLLTQIKNAQAVRKERLKVPYSKMNEQILDILRTNNYIKDFDKKGRKIKKILDIELKYDNEKGVISGIKFISKPSRRIYIGYKEIKPIKYGYGLMVISTSKGLMTGKEAKKMKLGGEVLFEIW